MLSKMQPLLANRNLEPVKNKFETAKPAHMSMALLQHIKPESATLLATHSTTCNCAAPLHLLALPADLLEALPARQKAKQEICTLTHFPATFFAVSVILARGVRSA